MAQKVWIVSRIEFIDGEFNLVEQEAYTNKDDAEVRWNEWITDIGFALEDMGADEDEIETKYDDEQLCYEMQYEGDYSWVKVKEVELV